MYSHETRAENSHEAVGRERARGVVSKQQIVMFVVIILILCVLSLTQLNHRGRGDKRRQNSKAERCIEML